MSFTMHTINQISVPCKRKDGASFVSIDIKVAFDTVKHSTFNATLKHVFPDNLPGMIRLQEICHTSDHLPQYTTPFTPSPFPSSPLLSPLHLSFPLHVKDTGVTS